MNGKHTCDTLIWRHHQSRLCAFASVCCERVCVWKREREGRTGCILYSLKLESVCVSVCLHILEWICVYLCESVGHCVCVIKTEIKALSRSLSFSTWLPSDILKGSRRRTEKALWQQTNCPAEMTDRHRKSETVGEGESIQRERERDSGEGKVFREGERTVFRDSGRGERGRACAVSLIWSGGRGENKFGGGGVSRQSGYCKKMSLWYS